MTRLDHPAAEWRRVSPKYVYLSFVGDLLLVLVLAAVTVVLLLLELPWFAWLWPAVLAALSLLSAALAPRRARAIGYQLREDDLLFRKGLLFTRIVAVPYGRMQLVDVQRGPLAQLFGLASLRLVTAAAASGVGIPGLPAQEAAWLRDQLVALAETRRAGL